MGSLEEALTVTTPTPHEPQSAAGVKPQSALTTSALESMPTSTTLVPTVEDGVEPQDIGWNRNDPEEEVETPDNARKHTNSGNSLTAAAAKRLTEAESSYLPLKTKYDADMNRVNAAGHRLDSGNSELMKRAERLMPQLHATACIATSSNASVPPRYASSSSCAPQPGFVRYRDCVCCRHAWCWRTYLQFVAIGDDWHPQHEGLTTARYVLTQS